MLLGVIVDGPVHLRLTATPAGVIIPGMGVVTPSAATDRITDALHRGGRWFSAHSSIPDDGRRATGILTAFCRVTRAL